MSNIYIQEPPTNGKVLLHTSVGDIDIELWSKEAPLACRNFVQLCLEGYYNGNVFHRLVKNFIVQTGDASGTGMGSESVYGSLYKDEFHSRLRFNRRGLVACANQGDPDSNGSQFFFTLDATPELQNKHTIFGKVTGNTLFNMLKLGEGEVDRNERPAHLRKIKSVEVLNNPFPDIVVRVKAEPKRDKTKEEKARENVKANKNFGLLSFGEEAEEEDKEIEEIQTQFKGKSKSSHDLLTDDDKLSSIPAVDTSQLKDIELDDSRQEDNEILRNSRLNKIKDKLKATKFYRKDTEDIELDSIFEEERSLEKNKNIETAKEEFEKLRKEMIQEMKDKKKPKESEAKKEKDAVVEEFVSEAKKYKIEIPKKGSTREQKLWEAMQGFKKNLTANKDKETVEVKTSWIKHKMQCTGEDEIVLARDANIRNEEDWYDINDPRNPINKRRREE